MCSPADTFNMLTLVVNKTHAVFFNNIEELGKSMWWKGRYIAHLLLLLLLLFQDFEHLTFAVPKTRKHHTSPGTPDRLLQRG
jgi:hypothetical protein